MARPREFSPYDPPSPRTRRGRQARERAVKEVLFWTESEGPKKKYMDNVRKEKIRHNVMLNADDIETLYDLNRLWETGMFRHIPDVVAERLLTTHMVGSLGKLKDGNVTFDSIGDPDNPVSIPPAVLVRLGLEVLRLYLLGVDPYMRQLVRRVVTADGNTLSLRRIMIGVSHSAAVMNQEYEIEDDDDFDFSSLDDIDFD